jgi:tetratricopeptide (TPR) repeat protein
VVPKEELLAALWPGAVVVDNALQRSVSLARAALAEAGLAQAVRTYARLGYRFCLDDCSEHEPLAALAPARPAAAAAAATATAAPVAAPPPTVDDGALAEARAAAARYDWSTACERYVRAQQQAALPPQEVLAWGRIALCAGQGASVLEPLERAVARLAASGDAVGAARAVLLLVQIRTDRMEPALAGGLLRRAARYLDGLPPCAEHGHRAWMSSRLALALGDAGAALRHADEALALARTLRDADVECLGLAYRGHALLAQGDFAGASEQHEEAAAAIRLGGVSLWVVGWVYCSVITASRNRCDWLRAAQWTQVFSEWCLSTRMSAFPGTCRLYCAEVLGVRGELDAAAAELSRTAAVLAEVAPWAEGDAYRALGEIRLTCGDLAGAEAAFRRAHALGWEPQPGLARLQIALGEPALAQRSLERALADGNWVMNERRTQLLCALVQAALAAGDTARAREALRTLQAEPQLLGTQALQAMAAQAQAALDWHEQRRSEAIQGLRQAVRHWHAVGSPPAEAEARLRLAECLLADADPAAAELELHAAECSPVLAGVAALQRRAQALRQALRG